VRWRRLGVLAGFALFLGIAYFSIDLADYVPPFPVDFEKFSAKMSWPSDRTDTIIGIVGLLLAILIPLAGYIYNRNRKLKSYFEVMWKKSSSLSPEEVLGLRGKPKHGFLDYYYERDNDKIIRDRISSNKNVLVLGNPLAGKSRAVYQALRSSDRDVLIPRLVDINLESFQIPFHLKFWRRRVVFFDDIDKFTDVQNFNYLIQAILKKKDIAIIATCRCGPEYAKLSGKMESQLSFIFEDPVEIAKISGEEADEIPKTIGGEMPSEFDGNIGSIFINLDAMRERFRGCDGIAKGILRSIRRLYYAGIYDEREVFSIERIKRVCEKVEEIDLKNYEWNTAINNLKDVGFIEVPDAENRLQAEEAYLQYVVGNGFNHIANLKYMSGFFLEDPEALMSIGNRAYNIGLIHIDKRDYLRIAIEAYREALKVKTLDRFPMDYAMTQNNLGAAYSTLAEVEDKSENCKRAIEAYTQALKVRTLDRFPIQYATTQNNLGAAYSTLAEVEDKSENCKRAIEAYTQALKVRTLDRFPIQYATTQNNLGAAYSTLAEVEDKSENCKRAIEAYTQALKVFTKEEFPEVHPRVEKNLKILLDFCKG
jgi:tetratricopeptide (TPR) repeat protein